MATKNTDITKPASGGALVVHDYGDHTGVGMKMDMDDLKIPFIQLSQTDSKILDSEEPNYVAGGSAGQLLNAATQRYSDSLLVVPAIRRTTYVEWKPNNAGFVAEHEANAEIVRDAKANSADARNLVTASGNELVFTKSLYAIVLNEETMEPEGFCVIPFSSSKLSPWRSYWTKIDTTKATKGAPIYAHTLRVAVKADKNKEGKKYFNLDLYPARDDDGNLASSVGESNAISSLIAPDSAAFLAAAQLFEMVSSGQATADHGTNSSDTDDSTPY